jgi:flagellar hook protein FlgE
LSGPADQPFAGEPLIGEPGSGNRGLIAAGALEMSNVALAQEFTNLIIAQRGFQANSRVITASDEVLADLVNLKR